MYHSAGIILYTLQFAEPLYLVVLQRNMRISFPKGNIERFETPQDAAKRELYEEAGIVLPQNSKLADALITRRKNIYYPVEIKDVHNIDFTSSMVPNDEIINVYWASRQALQSHIHRPNIDVVDILRLK